MRRSLWTGVSVLTMHTAGILHAQAQQDRIYPTGEFVLLGEMRRHLKDLSRSTAKSAVINETTWLGERGGRGETIHHWPRLRPGDVVIKRGQHVYVMLVCCTYNDRVGFIEPVGVSPGSLDEEKVRYRRYTFDDLR